MSTQKLPDGSVALTGLMPSMRRRVEPMVRASARNFGLMWDEKPGRPSFLL